MTIICCFRLLLVSSRIFTTTMPSKVLLWVTEMMCLCIVLPVMGFSCDGPDRLTAPNIVFILADDFGWNDIGYNNPDIKSPNIDHLAATGVILDQVYAQPSCTPSRAALLTGVYPYRMGLSHMVIAESQPVCVPLNRTFLPEALKLQGYSTHMVGKWHVGMCKWECTPTYRGFDSFYGNYHGIEDYYTKQNPNGGYDFRENESVNLEAAGTYTSYLYTERIKKIISSHDRATPLFLYLAFQNCHSPLQAPQEYLDLYPDIKDVNRRIFSAMVSAMDDTVGQTIQALEQAGLYKNTLIVFSGDNGGMVARGGNNFPLRGAKGTLFEGGTRVPAFVHGPMLHNRGVRYPGMIHMVDWFPTLLEASGLDNTIVPDQDGISQWQSLLHLLPSNRKEILYNLDDSDLPTLGKSAIRLGDHKLIIGFPGLYPDWYPPDESNFSYSAADLNEYVAFETSEFGQKIRTLKGAADVYKYLFNLKNDPEERYNLYDQEPEIVKQLQQRLDYHRTLYVEPSYPDLSPDSNPFNWGGAWTPGWC